MLGRAKSFYGKILLTIMLCFVVPMSIVFLVGYNRLEQVMAGKIEDLTRNNIRQMEERLEDLGDRVNQTSVYLSSDMRLNELLREYNSSIPEGAEFTYHTGQPEFIDKYDYLNLSVELQNILINYADNWLGESIEMGIIGNDGQIFSTWPVGNTDFEKLSEVIAGAREEQNTYFTDIHDSFIQYGNDSSYYTYVKVLYDIYSVDSKLGILIVTVPVSSVGDIVGRSLEWENNSSFVISGQNEIVYEFAGNIDREIYGQFLDMIPEEPGRLEMTVRDDNGERYMLQVIPVEGVEWRICCLVPYEEVFHDTLVLRRLVIGICAALIILFAVITVIVIYRLFAPLRALRDAMKKAEEGDWDIEPLPAVSNDEIGMLTTGFNRLMKELENFLEREKESERQKGELRFEMLLAQINPHFLFNTLNSIKWMAAMIHADNITSTIRSLARLLEISMNRQAEVIPIREEVENLKSYVEIQSVRYGDMFSVEYDISEEIEDCQTLKLVFQPIVENSIIHNIQEVNPLFISVSGKLEDGCLVLCVRDNGLGMDEEQIRNLMEKPDQSRNRIFRGIGVRNVQQRIQLKYGAGYGIRIRSEKGKGTDVEIRFPAVFCNIPEGEDEDAQSVDRG